MPARSCQCPERRAPIASRRWEVCSKPGDGTTVVRCKACGAIWTTRAKFVEALPYDIGPVTLPKDAFQHTRAIVALTMLDSLLYQFRPLVEDQPKVLREIMPNDVDCAGFPERQYRQGLVWTKEEPMHEGWYWWKCAGIIGIDFVKEGGKRVLNDKTALWAGPIPQPQEATR